jgi:polysaccharide deacetylase 2 family uncharacterized protein YibQ
MHLFNAEKLGLLHLPLHPFAEQPTNLKQLHHGYPQGHQYFLQ